jgi:hypothetical protein
MTETKPGGHFGRLWLACVLATTAIAQAQTAAETVLHSFGNFPHGAGVTLDSAGCRGGIRHGCFASLTAI